MTQLYEYIKHRILIYQVITIQVITISTNKKNLQQTQEQKQASKNQKYILYTLFYHDLKTGTYPMFNLSVNPALTPNVVINIVNNINIHLINNPKNN